MTEQYILIFVAGYILGVISTILFTRKGVSIESTVSLLIITVWLGMHTYGFLFERDVSLLMDFMGFGASGNFIGIKFSDLTDYVVKIGKKR